MGNKESSIDKETSKKKESSTKKETSNKKESSTNKKTSNNKESSTNKMSKGAALSVILDKTKFAPSEIRKYEKEFLETCPDGILTLEKFKVLYGDRFKGDADDYAEQVFRTFDRDGSGTIDFKEFMIGTSIASRGSSDDKLKWAFNLYDLDGNGFISKAEMREMIENVFKMIRSTEGMSEDENAPEKIANKLYELMDDDKDGNVSLKEFVRVARKDPKVMKILLGAEGKESEAEGK